MLSNTAHKPHEPHEPVRLMWVAFVDINGSSDAVPESHIYWFWLFYPRHFKGILLLALFSLLRGHGELKSTMLVQATMGKWSKI